MLPVSHISPDRMLVAFDIENFIGGCSQLGMPIEAAPELQQLAKIATVLIKLSFGEIRSMPAQFSKQSIYQMLQANHVIHEEVPHCARQKNSADIRLTVAVLHIAYTRPDITHFAIIGHDRDFIPLMNHLRSMGKVIVGWSPSRKQTSPLYRSACDFFLYHDELVPETREKPQAFSSQMIKPATKPISTPKELTDADRLRNAIHSVTSSGKLAVASQVCSAMREMYPGFAYAARDGSFKYFCKRLVDEGAVLVDNIELCNFLLTVNKEAETVISPSVKPLPSIESAKLVTIYREWVVKKFGMDMPRPDQRRSFYSALSECVSDANNYPPLKLQSLSQWLGVLVPEVNLASFRILYGLVRSGAILTEAGENQFNPIVVGVNVPVEQLDFHFVVSTLTLFRNESRTLPFDSIAWSQVFHGDESAANAIRHVAQFRDISELRVPAVVNWYMKPEKQ